MRATDAPVETAQAIEFFDRTHETFQRALRLHERAGLSFRLAGEGMALEVAGASLAASLIPALAHLRAEAQPTGLRICAWAGASGGTAPPAPIWSDDDYYANSQIRGFTSGRIRAAFDTVLGMLSLYDVERGLALFWLRDARHVPITIVGTPLRIVFQWWADLHDRILIHAAAVGSIDRMLVIAGPSGAGKSTTALIALAHGFRYAGDDFVLIQAEPVPRVHSMYGSAKLDGATLAARFPELAGAIHDRPRLVHEKETVFVNERWPEQMADPNPVHAVLLPIVMPSAESRLVRVSSAEALRALVPGVLPFPGMRQSAVERLGRIVRQVPSYRLELGYQASGVVSALREALA